MSWDAVDAFDETYPHLWVKVEHLGRYLWAANVIEETGITRVADIACGTGFGLEILSSRAKYLIGVDWQTTAAQEAAKTLQASGDAASISIVQSNLDVDTLSEQIPDASLDAIVSFETIEHLLDPERALHAFRRTLSSSGTLLCSVPRANHERVDRLGRPTNREHSRIFSFEEIHQLLRKAGFQVSYQLGQPWANQVSRHEALLIRNRTLQHRLGDYDVMHTPDIMHQFAMLFGYPTTKDVESSYSCIILAHVD